MKRGARTAAVCGAAIVVCGLALAVRFCLRAHDLPPAGPDVPPAERALKGVYNRSEWHLRRLAAACMMYALSSGGYHYSQPDGPDAALSWLATQTPTGRDVSSDRNLTAPLLVNPDVPRQANTKRTDYLYHNRPIQLGRRPQDAVFILSEKPADAIRRAWRVADDWRQVYAVVDPATDTRDLLGKKVAGFLAAEKVVWRTPFFRNDIWITQPKSAWLTLFWDSDDEPH